MQVILEHNPYQGSLQILVNGQTRPRLSRYSSKPFSVWYKDIFTLLDGEMNEPYSIRFIGREYEAGIAKRIAAGTRYCREFGTEMFSDKASVAERVKNITGVSGIEAKVRICALPSIAGRAGMENIDRLFSGIESCNNIWRLKVSHCGVGSLSDNSEQYDYMIVIAGSRNELSASIIDTIKRAYYSEVCFIIADGGNNIEFIGNTPVMHCGMNSTADELNCYLYSVILGDLFCGVYCRLSDEQKKCAAFRTKELPKVELPSMIEQGVETRISVSSSSGSIPEIEIFARNESVIKTSRKGITGISDGSTLVQVFEAGTSQLLASREVTVRTIPRIRELYADDVGLRHGEELNVNAGESFTVPFSYAPPNAENVDDICWSSSNSTIVSVHRKTGVMTANRQGHCIITCAAGAVDFDIAVSVTPGLKSIELKDLYGNSIVMNTGETYELKWECIPSNAHYGNIIVRSGNSSIVQTDGNVIRAVSEGEACVHIIEEIYHVQLELNVKVLNCTKPKKGILSKLFSK